MDESTAWATVGSAFFACILGVVIALCVAGQHSQAEKTEKLKACVAAGGQWTDVTKDDYANYGCVRP